MNLALRAQVIGYFVFGFTLHRYIAYWLHNRNAQLYAYMRFSRNKFYIVGHGIVDACAMEFCGCSCCIEFDLFVIFAKIHSFLLQSICLFVIECTELLQYPVISRYTHIYKSQFCLRCVFWVHCIRLICLCMRKRVMLNKPKNNIHSHTHNESWQTHNPRFNPIKMRASR